MCKTFNYQKFTLTTFVDSFPTKQIENFVKCVHMLIYFLLLVKCWTILRIGEGRQNWILIDSTYHEAVNAYGPCKVVIVKWQVHHCTVVLNTLLFNLLSQFPCHQKFRVSIFIVKATIKIFNSELITVSTTFQYPIHTHMHTRTQSLYKHTIVSQVNIPLTCIGIVAASFIYECYRPTDTDWSFVKSAWMLI